MPDGLSNQWTIKKPRMGIDADHRTEIIRGMRGIEKVGKIKVGGANINVIVKNTKQNLSIWHRT